MASPEPVLISCDLELLRNVWVPVLTSYDLLRMFKLPAPREEMFGGWRLRERKCIEDGNSERRSRIKGGPELRIVWKRMLQRGERMDKAVSE